MDGPMFDAIARMLADGSSRRGVLKTLAGTILGGAAVAGGRRGASADCGAVGRPCRRHGDCCGTAFCGDLGRCRCLDGRTDCSGRCENLQTDEANCGACGHRCAAGQTCVAGECGGGGGCTPGGSGCSTPQRPFPQHLVYAAGTIRPNHRSRAQQDNDVRLAYGRWKQRYLIRAGSAAGGPLYRVAQGKPGTAEHNRTTSEGQGYGLVIVPHLAGHDPDAQAIVDGLWRYALEHRSCIDDRLMLWTFPNRRDDGCDSAFDGDADIAYGLLLADAQWGSAGAIDYRAAARTVIDGILGSTIGPNSRLPLLGDWVDPNDRQHNEFTPRTSDFVPGHFRAFGRATAPAVWGRVIRACQGVVTTLQADHSPRTGLLPDFARGTSADVRTYRPVDGKLLETRFDGDYFYNAGRDPWRLGTDGLVNGDTVSLHQVRKIATWAKAATGGDPEQIRHGYHLDGTPLNNFDFSTFFAAPLGVAAMSVASQQPFLNAIYDAVRDAPEDYFEDTVTLLCLLVMTGNFWDPTQG